MSGVTRELFVEGIALWAARLPGWPAACGVLRGETAAADSPLPRPAPTLLPPAERRRAPDTVAVALEVAASACAHAGRDPQSMASVFASTHGDLAVSDALCETLAKAPAMTSPTRFHNSVHNAAAGYWTIGTGCVKPYTALSAHTASFAEGLLESAVQAHSEQSAVLYIAYDIAARGPAATMQTSLGVLGTALVLSPQDSGRTRARLSWRVEESTAQATPPRPANAALVAGNAMAPCLTLFEALADETPRAVVQRLSPYLALQLQLRPR